MAYFHSSKSGMIHFTHPYPIKRLFSVSKECKTLKKKKSFFNLVVDFLRNHPYQEDLQVKSTYGEKRTSVIVPWRRNKLLAQLYQGTDSFSQPEAKVPEEERGGKTDKSLFFFFYCFPSRISKYFCILDGPATDSVPMNVGGPPGE